MKALGQLLTTFLRHLWSAWGILYSIIVLFAIALVVVTAVIALDEYRQFRNGPLAENQQAQVENELQNIAAPSSSVFVRHSTTHKFDHGAVSNIYKTNLPYREIRTFYDKEMSLKGWVFLKEERSLFNRQDYGGKHAFYCKGLYSADLEYAGQLESDFGWTYSLAVSWHLGGVNGCK